MGGACSASVKRMTIQRMDHVGIVVDHLASAKAFFVELGLKLQGEGFVAREESGRRSVR